MVSTEFPKAAFREADWWPAYGESRSQLLWRVSIAVI